MRTLADFLARHGKIVVAVWAAIVLLSLPFAARQTENLTAGGFDVPGSESAAVAADLEAGLAADSRSAAGALLVASPDADAVGIRSAVAELTGAVRDIKGLQLSPRAGSEAAAALALEGSAVVEIASNVPQDQLTDLAVDLRDLVGPGVAHDGVTTYLTGQHAAWAGLQELSKHDLEKAEISGFPIIALILLVVFGSLAAASLPLALGFGSVVVTGALIWLISQQMEMSVFVTNMASMIGIGVAVDYSLFILARFREEIEAGQTVAAARAEALATSGMTVLFSGTAVIISLAGLWMVSNQALRSMALGAMVVVAVAMLTAVLLLPALISVLGHRVQGRSAFFSKLSRLPRPRLRRSDVGFWDAWTRRVMRRPVVSLVLAGSVMLALAVPVLWMQTGTSALSQFPADHDVRVGTELALAETGGAADPILVRAEFSSADRATAPESVQALRAIRAGASELPAVDRVNPIVVEGASGLVAIYPRGASDSKRSARLVAAVRSDLVEGSRLASMSRVDVGGETARMVDVQAQISGAMWKIIAFILALSFLILMVMLRSILLPLKAILMNLLSIGAAYGVLVIVFQWGWLDGLLGFDSLGAIDTLNPPLILAVVFGLSMDYEVFLLSRIRERYQVHGDNERAVAEGLASSARTITSAAAIMTSVFAVFALTGVPSIKELGVGNAVAIALDATLVRLVLVPAAMQLMGSWNWWVPSWLDRRLPEFDLEGTAGGIETGSARA